MGNGNRNGRMGKRNQLKARRQGGTVPVSAVVGTIHRDLQLTSQVVKTRVFQNPQGYTADQVNAACGNAAADVTAALAAIDQAVTSLGGVINTANTPAAAVPTADATPAAAPAATTPPATTT